MEVALILLPIFGGSIVIVGIVFFTLYRINALKSKERLAAIEKGLPVENLDKSPKELSHGQRCLHRGIMFLFTGVGLAIAIYFSGGGAAGVWGLFVAFIGLGYLANWLLTGRKEPKNGNGCC
jgi:hypothetical protein